MNREEAYRTVESMTVEDVAREIGVTPEVVLKACREGRLAQGADGSISGKDLADFLEASKTLYSDQ
jgi:hypothetical protein